MGNGIQPDRPSPQRIPTELKKLNQWVVWRLEESGKVPYQANGRPASSTNPKTWTSIEKASAAKGFDGIGFVFSPDDPYCGIDLDGCVNESGQVHPDAQKLIGRVGSYTEYSPSGTGVHILMLGELGEGFKGDSPWGKVEMYDRGRYFTITGKQLGRRRAINGRVDPKKLRASLAEYHDDTKVLKKALRGSPKLEALFSGESRDEYGDGRSDADYALAKELAKRTTDTEQIARLLWRSGLADRTGLDHPDKWTEHPEYVLDTAKNALEEVGFQRQRPDRWSQWTGDEETDFERQLHVARVRGRVRESLGADELRYELADLTLREELAIPDPELRERIEGLHPAGGNAVFVASQKLGKTSVAMNVLRSLADGELLFDAFEVEPVEGGIAVFDYESTKRQWKEWVRKVGIKNDDHIIPLFLRGQGVVPIWLPKERDKIVEWMIRREIRYWVIDPAAVAWVGLVDNENDNALVARFTTAIDEVKRLAGIEEALVTHHSGREDLDRGRGATRLDDWADSIWTLKGKRDELEFGARGRDVGLEFRPLVFNSDTHLFTRRPEKELEAEQEAQQAKQVARDKTIKQTIIEVLEREGRLSQNTLLSEVNISLKRKGETGLSSKTFIPKIDGYVVSPGPIARELEGEGKNKTKMYYLKG